MIAPMLRPYRLNTSGLKVHLLELGIGVGAGVGLGAGVGF